MKFMYTSAFGLIIDCIKLIWGIYTDIVVWYLHMNLFACVAYIGIWGA